MCIFTQIQLRLSRSDPAEWIGKKNRAVNNSSQWHRKNRWTSAIFSKLWASFLVIWPWKLSCFFSARTPTALVSISSWLLNASLFWPISPYLTELIAEERESSRGVPSPGKGGSSPGVLLALLTFTAQQSQSQGSCTEAADQLRNMFSSINILYSSTDKEEEEYINLFGILCYLGNYFLLQKKLRFFLNVLFFLYQVSQYVHSFGNFPIVRGTKDCFS